MQKKQPQELFKLTGVSPKLQSGTFDVVLHDQVWKQLNNRKWRSTNRCLKFQT
jgi:hypothetical protein